MSNEKEKQHISTAEINSDHKCCSSIHRFGHFIYLNLCNKKKRKTTKKGKINGKRVNIFQHWYTCCTVAHLFYVLPRGSSLKIDVKFNTCLTKSNKCEIFGEIASCFLTVCVFATFWGNRLNYFAIEKSPPFDSGYKSNPQAPSKVKRLFSGEFICFLLLFFLL